MTQPGPILDYERPSRKERRQHRRLLLHFAAANCVTAAVTGAIVAAFSDGAVGLACALFVAALALVSQVTLIAVAESVAPDQPAASVGWCWTIGLLTPVMALGLAWAGAWGYARVGQNIHPWVAFTLVILVAGLITGLLAGYLLLLSPLARRASGAARP